MVERGASGLRKSPFITLTDEDIAKLKEDIKAIEADESVFVFNIGQRTSYLDSGDIIFIRSDVLPSYDNSLHPRDLMSARAVLAHEYYGHKSYKGTPLRRGAWNDEFRASYMAAKNAPNLIEQDRMFLILDAMERAKEAGITIKLNTFMRRV